AAAVPAWPARAAISRRWGGNRSARTPAGTPTKNSGIDRDAIASPTRNGELVSSRVSHPSTTVSPIIPTALHAVDAARQRKLARRKKESEGTAMGARGRPVEGAAGELPPPRPG